MRQQARRSLLNRNLTIYDENIYRGWPVYQRKGPLIEQWLERAYDTTKRSLEAHHRTLAIRFDLRFPQDTYNLWIGRENVALQRFFESFEEKIKYDRWRTRMVIPYARDSDVRYIWARERDKSDAPHFHCVLLLNRDAYGGLGDIRSERENIANRVRAAWGSALGMPWYECYSLIHFTKRGVYRLDWKDQNAIQTFFYRVSYLCKEATKSYDIPGHPFGCSRR